MSTTFQATEIVMLTTISLIRPFSMEHPEWLYILPVADKNAATLSVLITYTDGNTDTKVIPIGNLRTSEVVVINISEANQLYTEVDDTKTIQKMVMSVNSTDDTLTLYPFYPSEKSDQVVALYYHNSYGGLDSLICMGDYSDTLEAEQLIVEQPIDETKNVTTHPQFLPTYPRGRRGVDQHTGYKTEDELLALRDMLLLNKGYEYQSINGQQVLLPIIFQNASITLPSKKTNARAMQLQYRRASVDYALDRIGGIKTEVETLKITNTTHIFMYFDNSGSMSATLSPLETMVDTLLRPALIGFYDNDDDLYDERVTVTSVGPSGEFNERTLRMLNYLDEDPPEGNVVVMVFQDEANNDYHGTNFDGTRTANYDSDLATLLSRLSTYSANYYRGVIFQVLGTGSSNEAFKSFLQAVQTGSGNYAGSNGLSNRSEFVYKYDITNGAAATYYLDQVTDALEELGFVL